MAGGMLFMAVITLFLGVSEAMVVHGAVQGISNASRAAFLRSHIKWRILALKLLGALPVIAILVIIAFQPDKRFLFIVLGLLPFLLWLPKGWFQGDASRPRHAFTCGAVVICLNLSAGVAGPALDYFYIKTPLSRQEIVATKAITMLFSHLVKIIFYGIPLLTLCGVGSLPPLWVFFAAIPCVIAGTYVGTRILHRLNDIRFKSWTKYLVTAIGVYYLCRAAGLFGGISSRLLECQL